MNTVPLLSCSILELMKLWGELTKALHGIGGNAIDIRLAHLAHSALLVELVPGAEADPTAAADALYVVCAWFAKTHECKVEIDGWTPEEWIGKVTPRLDAEYRVRVTE